MTKKIRTAEDLLFSNSTVPWSDQSRDFDEDIVNRAPISDFIDKAFGIEEDEDEEE